jgi:hypothetical protein
MAVNFYWTTLHDIPEDRSHKLKFRFWNSQSWCYVVLQTRCLHFLNTKTVGYTLVTTYKTQCVINQNNITLTHFQFLEVSTVVIIKIIVFFVVTLHRLVCRCWCFWGTYYNNFQSLKMETAYSDKTTHCHNPQGQSLSFQSLKNMLTSETPLFELKNIHWHTDSLSAVVLWCHWSAFSGHWWQSLWEMLLEQECTTY